MAKVTIDKKYDDYVDFPLMNAPVKWAKVQPHQGDSYKGAPEKFGICVYLPKKLAAEMKKAGFLIKEDDDGFFVNPKRAKFEKDGTTLKAPIFIVGRDGRTLITDEIGNGSVCNINISAKNWDTGFISTYIKGIQVLDLVEYKGAGGFTDVDEEGSFA